MSVNHNELGFYWNHKEGSIETILNNQHFLDLFNFAAITEVDSDRNVVDAFKYINSNGKFFDKLNFTSEYGNCIIAKKDFKKIARHFHGFDEIIFFNKKPGEFGIADFSLAGSNQDDLISIINDVKFCELYDSLHCSVMFGDGLGLSYITKMGSIATYITNMFDSSSERI